MFREKKNKEISEVRKETDREGRNQEKEEGDKERERKEKQLRVGN